jgi:hypothetical protein
LESARLKKEITEKTALITDLAKKSPEKAAKILSDWINSAQAKQNPPPARRKSPLR